MSTINLGATTITILFTDIEGSTRLWEEFPEAMDEALVAHDAILNGAIKSNRGTVVKTTGDGIYAVFKSAPMAIAAVIAAQKALISHPWNETGPIRVRMGLHTGQARGRQGDYYGPPVNRASRLMSLAAGQQILISSVTADLVRDRLSRETTLVDLGLRQLKGLTRPEQIFQLVHADLPSDFPPLGSRKKIPHNLPRSMNSFVGRQEEILAIRQSLLVPGNRLLTLTGPGGVGKTRFSLHLARECMDHFPDGVFFVPLAEVSKDAFVALAIMQALDLPTGGVRSPVEQLKTRLAESEMLLILDNLEHLPGARIDVRQFLRGAPGMKVLATSRSSLGIYGEMVFNIRPLELPEAGAQNTYQEMLNSPPVALFLERARAVKHDFVIREHEMQTVVDICARLDNLPLAIELAAVRMRTISPRELLERLSSGTRFLLRRVHFLPERHQNLYVTMQWSYELLAREDRKIFRRLAIFVGGCTLEAAESVCDLYEHFFGKAMDVLGGLDRLIDQNLLTQSVSDGRSRYSMLEIIHDFAHHQLRYSDEWESARRTHSEFYLAMAQEAEQALLGAEQPVWMRRLAAEHENLSAALSYLSHDDPPLALNMLSALRRFFHFQGLFQEGLEWFDEALDRHAELDLEPGAALARGLSEAGNLAWFYGKHEKSYELQLKSVALWRELEDEHALALALWQLAKATWTAKEDSTQALDLVRQSVAMLRQMGDPVGLANALMWSGFMLTWDGSAEQARRDLEESAELAAATNFANVLAAATSGLGRLDFQQEDYRAAQSNFEESLALFREIEDLPGILIVLSVYGELLHAMGDFAGAEACYLEAIQIEKAIHGKSFGRTRCLLIAALCRQDKVVEAKRQSEEEPNYWPDEPEPSDKIAVLTTLSLLEAANGNDSLATQLLGYVDKSMESLGEAQLSVVFEIEHDRLRRDLRSRLGRWSFKANWNSGRQLTEQQLGELLHP